MKKIITLISILLLSSLIFLYYKYDNKSISEIKTKQELKNSSMLSLMIETEAGSGKYNVSTTNTFPSDEYVFNKDLSKCENGSELSWDEQAKKVILKGDITDKCYVYFDVYVEPVVTLSNYVISKYTGTQGENGLYYHDSSLTNGAGDNSYRYAGSDPSNYVCFGSDETTCPYENLYRIIGVFDDKVKLIKADYAKTSLLGTDGDYEDIYSNSTLTTSYYKGNISISAIGVYYWNNSQNKSWSNSSLNKVNLNTNFIKKIGTKWTNLIAETSWKISGHSKYNITPKEMFTTEIINATETYNDKIGLMYVSDYGFSVNPSLWISKLNVFSDDKNLDENWMYMGLDEWTITPHLTTSNSAFYLLNLGDINSDIIDEGSCAVRPTFYLNSSVIFSSGDGTKTNPIRISAE